MTPPQRRQNSSCDPCRRSKRRRFFASSHHGDTGVACTNCKRLGHVCTFDFVKSRASSKRQRPQNRSQPPRWRQGSALSTPEYPGNGFTSFANVETEADIADHDIWASWLDLGVGPCFEQDKNCLGLSDTATTANVAEGQLSVSSNRSDRTEYFVPSIVGISLDSPIRLLNSKLDAAILDERLVRIYNTIIAGCASRFVEYDCNLYATASRYRFEGGIAESSHGQMDSQLELLPHPISPQLLSSEAQTNSASLNDGPAMRDHGCMLTVLGAVRFLDHFSDLYGNRLTLAARRQSDAVLKAVLQAFSLQWLTTSDATSGISKNLLVDNANGSQKTSDAPTHVFHEAWIHARSLLNSALSVRSFRVVYAILLFDGISIPTEARSGLTEPVIAHEFLNAGLDKLRYLDILVKKYCATLGPQSTYSTLLDASLNVARWGGYIRDIGAALTTDHRCKLPGIPPHEKVQEEYFNHRPILEWSDDQHLRLDLDNRVVNVCQEAVAKAFSIWRNIVEVKRLSSDWQVQSGVYSTLDFSEAVTSTVRAIGKFNKSFQSFMESCVENLEHLSTRSKTSSVSIILFWNLSVLLLAELLKPIKGERPYISEHLALSMSTHQEEAISSVARTVESILWLPPEGLFNIENGLGAEVPLIAYHITPGLTATTFQKTIESIITVHCAELNTDQSAQLNIAAGSDWKRQIDIVMKGFGMLDVTIGGSQAASSVLQSLMWRHGDILLECWTSDFST